MSPVFLQDRRRLVTLVPRRLSPAVLLVGCAICVQLYCPLRAHAADPAATQPATTQSPATQQAVDRTELLVSTSSTKPAAGFDPIESYVLQTIEGWPVRVNQRLPKAQPDMAAKTIELLRFQLFQIARAVPAPALAKLQTVTIWVEDADPLVPCMCYHPSRTWVIEHGLNPAKAHGVELGNPKVFLEWTHNQPWMVFHELAHAYHDQFLQQGFENPKVLTVYQAAKDAKLYESVLRIDGRTARAYAMTSPMEYFAENSEAFFGTNDFYPFVRGELKNYDPDGYAVLAEAWEMEPKLQNAPPASKPSPASPDTKQSSRSSLGASNGRPA